MYRTTRRSLLTSSLASAGAVALSAPAIAQAARPIKFTLSWLAQGTSVFIYAGREKGFFKSRGIDLQISRGFGSLAAAQSIAAGQFDYGIVIGAPLILMITKGLPLVSLGTVDYDAMMGIGAMADGPVKDPKALVGHKLGTVPASAESPFFPAYAQKIGIDPKSVDVTSIDPKVLERTLSSKEVDAITGVASSSLPVLLSQKQDVKWFLYSSAGIPTNGNNLVTTETSAKDEALCSAMADGVMESLKFALTNPQEAADLFFKAVPEAALNADGKKFVEIGMGLHRYAIAKPDPQGHGLGWTSLKTFEDLTDLVMQYTAAPGAARPDVNRWYTNKYVGRVTLSKPQWDAVIAASSDYVKYLS